MYSEWRDSGQIQNEVDWCGRPYDNTKIRISYAVKDYMDLCELVKLWDANFRSKWSFISAENKFYFQKK